ncbi:MAG: hypothetical protein ACRCZ5_06780 [Burkholderiales bacterium]
MKRSVCIATLCAVLAPAVLAENYAYDPVKNRELQKRHCQKFLDQISLINKREKIGFKAWEKEKMDDKRASLKQQFDSECALVRDELLASGAAKPARK